jgi:2-hydroxychromene-2-carboxylate isomerase
LALTVDYYLAPQSPYVYMGHARLAKACAAAGARIRLRPVDLGGKIFPVSGGLPLGQRAPQRQAYRLLELRRFSEHLGLRMNIQPRHFPVAGDDAARLIIAVDLHDGTQAGMRIAGAVLTAVWAEERNIADEKVLTALLDEQGLAAERLTQSRTQAVQETYERYTQEAIDAGVFGAPSYVIEGELFWGQDRLDFVERRLAKGA